MLSLVFFTFSPDTIGPLTGPECNQSGLFLVNFPKPAFLMLGLQAFIFVLFPSRIKAEDIT